MFGQDFFLLLGCLENSSLNFEGQKINKKQINLLPMQSSIMQSDQKILCHYCLELPAVFLTDCFCVLCAKCETFSDLKKCPLCGLIITSVRKINDSSERKMKKVLEYNPEQDMKMSELAYQAKLTLVRRYQEKIAVYEKVAQSIFRMHPDLKGFFEKRIDNLNAGKKKLQSKERHQSKKNSKDGPLKPERRRRQ